MIDASSVIALFAFFLGFGLCLWRFPKADRWHEVLCLIAAGLWIAMIVFEPRTRVLPFLLGTTFLFLFSMGQCLKGSHAEPPAG